MYYDCYDYDIHPSHLVAKSSGQTGLRWPVGHSGLRVMSGVEPSQHTCRWTGGVCLATLCLPSKATDQLLLVTGRWSPPRPAPRRTPGRLAAVSAGGGGVVSAVRPLTWGMMKI